MLGVWVRRAALAWAGILAVLLVLPLVDVSSTSVVPMVQALFGAWVLLCVPTVAGLLWLRRWVAAALVGVAAVVGLLPAVLAGNGVDAPTDGTVLTVLSVNLEYSDGDPEQVAAAIRRLEADVVVLVEVDDAYLDLLRSTGVDDVLVNGWEREVAGGSAGTTVLSRYPLGEAGDWPDDHDYRFETPILSVRVGERDVLVRGIHTLPPVPPPPGTWRRELRAIGQWVDTLPDDQPVVLAGDFNAGRTHPAFRDAVGDLSLAPSALARTWPVGGRVPTFVGIDHIAARGLAPESSGTIVVDGTDHRAVWARLVLTPRS